MKISLPHLNPGFDVGEVVDSGENGFPLVLLCKLSVGQLREDSSLLLSLRLYVSNLFVCKDIKYAIQEKWHHNNGGNLMQNSPHPQ